MDLGRAILESNLPGRSLVPPAGASDFGQNTDSVTDGSLRVEFLLINAASSCP